MCGSNAGIKEVGYFTSKLATTTLVVGKVIIFVTNLTRLNNMHSPGFEK